MRSYIFYKLVDSQFCFKSSFLFPPLPLSLNKVSGLGKISSWGLIGHWWPTTILLGGLVENSNLQDFVRDLREKGGEKKVNGQLVGLRCISRVNNHS